MKRLGRILALALAFGLDLTACGSDARAIDTCKQIENLRCTRGPTCIEGFSGTVASCQKFYEVQCGRGVPESAKEPSRADLNQCLELMKNDCAAVREPAKFCPFLVANDQPTTTDTGVSIIPDMGGAGDSADAD